MVEVTYVNLLKVYSLLETSMFRIEKILSVSISNEGFPKWPLLYFTVICSQLLDLHIGVILPKLLHHCVVGLHKDPGKL